MSDWNQLKNLLISFKNNIFKNFWNNLILCLTIKLCRQFGLDSVKQSMNECSVSRRDFYWAGPCTWIVRDFHKSISDHLRRRVGLEPRWFIEPVVWLWRWNWKIVIVWSEKCATDSSFSRVSRADERSLSQFSCSAASAMCELDAVQHVITFRRHW